MAMDVVNSQATLNLVKQGVIDATIGQKPFTMAYYGLKQVVELHESPLKQLDKDYETELFLAHSGVRRHGHDSGGQEQCPISSCMPGRKRRNSVTERRAKRPRLTAGLFCLASIRASIENQSGSLT